MLVLAPLPLWAALLISPTPRVLNSSPPIGLVPAWRRRSIRQVPTGNAGYTSSPGVYTWRELLLLVRLWCGEQLASWPTARPDSLPETTVVTTAPARPPACLPAASEQSERTGRAAHSLTTRSSCGTTSRSDTAKTPNCSATPCRARSEPRLGCGGSRAAQRQEKEQADLLGPSAPPIYM